MASKPKMGGKPVVGKTPGLETEDKPRERIEREDVGGDESYFAFINRLGKEFLDLSLENKQRNRLHFDIAMQRGQSFYDTLGHIMASRLGDAAGGVQDRMTRSAKHDDLAADRMWNVDEVAQLVSKTALQLDAVATALASIVASLAEKVSEAAKA